VNVVTRPSFSRIEGVEPDPESQYRRYARMAELPVSEELVKAVQLIYKVVSEMVVPFTGAVILEGLRRTLAPVVLSEDQVPWPA